MDPTPLPLPPRENFAGVHVSIARMEDVLARIGERISSGKQLCVTFLNPDYARRALIDPPLRDEINDFDLVLADGNGVRLLAPLFGFVVPERLATDEVTPPLFRQLASLRQSVFLFGCAPGIADKAASRLVDSFPGLVIAGTEHGFHDVARGHPGYFDASDSARIVARVNTSRADLLLVSLPTPLQQRWVIEHRDYLRVPVIMTGGSYLDHAASMTTVAASWYPQWATVLRLNWLYRLAQEPRRLWRRYSIELCQFAFLALRARLQVGRREITVQTDRPPRR